MISSPRSSIQFVTGSFGPSDKHPIIKTQFQEDSIIALSKILYYYSKFSEYLYMGWSAEKIIMSVKTISGCCFAVVHLEPCFFADFIFATCPHESEEFSLGLKVSLKTLLPVFRRLRQSISGGNKKVFESCFMSLDLKENLLILESSLVTGIRKRHEIFFEETELFRPTQMGNENSPNRWYFSSKPKLILDNIEFFEKQLDLISIEKVSSDSNDRNVKKQQLTLKSPSESRIQTRINIDACEFDIFSNNNGSSPEPPITVSLMALKNMYLLGQHLGLSIDCCFSGGESPFYGCIKSNGMLVEFVLATITDDDAEGDAANVVFDGYDSSDSISLWEKEDRAEDLTEIPATPQKKKIRV